MSIFKSIFNRKRESEPKADSNKPICLMIGRPCPMHGMNGETPVSATQDYCPAWVSLDHKVNAVTAREIGKDTVRREGCMYPMLPFIVNGAIFAANIARDETIALREEESLRYRTAGDLLHKLFSGVRSVLPGSAGISVGNKNGGQITPPAESPLLPD